MFLITSIASSISYLIVLKKGAGDDLVIAEDIINRMKNKDRVVIIREDLPVNVLRPILHNLDFVLGERTHSIINSTSMCTPYFMLTCKMDFRSHDIIGKGIGLPNQIIDLDSPRIDDVTATVIKGISNRKSIKQHLESYKSIVAKKAEKLYYLLFDMHPNTIKRSNKERPMFRLWFVPCDK